VWGVGTGECEVGKIGGGRVRELRAGKSGGCRILKEGKWGENAHFFFLIGTGCTTLFPFPHGSLRVLSKSLLVHALGWKKSSQECLICGKNVKFNFGKLSPAVVSFPY